MSQMNKREAIEDMERIQKYFMDIHYPLKHAMYDREKTVKEVFDKALEFLKEESEMLKTLTSCPDCGGKLNIDDLNSCCELYSITGTCEECEGSFTYNGSIGYVEE